MERLFMLVLGMSSFLLGSFIMIHDWWVIMYGDQADAVLTLLIAAAGKLGMGNWMAAVMWVLPMAVGTALVAMAELRHMERPLRRQVPSVSPAPLPSAGSPSSRRPRPPTHPPHITLQ